MSPSGSPSSLARLWIIPARSCRPRALVVSWAFAVPGCKGWDVIQVGATLGCLLRREKLLVGTGPGGGPAGRDDDGVVNPLTWGFRRVNPLSWAFAALGVVNPLSWAFVGRPGGVRRAPGVPEGRGGPGRRIVGNRSACATEPGAPGSLKAGFRLRRSSSGRSRCQGIRKGFGQPSPRIVVDMDLTIRRSRTAGQAPDTTCRCHSRTRRSGVRICRKPPEVGRWPTS